MSNSDFAKRQLKKHGWQEGSGLGRDEDGRAEPIKVSLKMDKTGVGHDPGKEFTDHWWLRVFNEAAQKIGSKSKTKSAEPESEEVKAKTKREQQRKNFYKGFVKSSTLTNGVEEKTESCDSSSEDEEDAANSVSVPTLDDIHKFCGGATGHKAASFGIRMGGKVDRASHHEKQFEELVTENGLDGSKNVVGDDSLLQSVPGDVRKKKKKKKQDRERNAAENENIDRSNPPDSQSINNLEDGSVGNASVNSESLPSKKKHKKKRKHKEEESIENACNGDLITSEVDTKCENQTADTVELKKKKKKRKRQGEDEHELELEADNMSSETKEKKRKKKKDKSI